MREAFFQIYLAFLGSLGFSILFHITSTRLFFASFGGAISWGVYLALNPLFSSEALRYFLATAVIALYAEIMAKIQKTPTTTYLVPSIIPLIPGSALYSTMNYALRGEWEAFSAEGLFTLQIALSLAGGILVVSSATSVYKSLLHHFMKKAVQKKKGKKTGRYSL